MGAVSLELSVKQGPLRHVPQAAESETNAEESGDHAARSSEHDGNHRQMKCNVPRSDGANPPCAQRCDDCTRIENRSSGAQDGTAYRQPQPFTQKNLSDR